MGPGVLANILHGLSFDTHPQLLVGLEKADDAAVFRISETQALVQTVDFFPPIVDDPYDFGYITAVHAMSDIYAMGAVPTLALAIAAMPADLPPTVIQQIFQGGIDAVRRAGAIVAGGHTITDPEPKYGMAVTGIVDPAHLAIKRNLVVGNCLLLSKPLGTGIITTAAMNDRADPSALAAAVAKMKELNVMASKTAIAHDVDCMTDVTGFGLIGHILEMLQGSDLGVTIEFDAIPFLPTVAELAAAGHVSGGLRRNRATYEATGLVSYDPSIADHLIDILYDPQTSGGLLVSLPERECESLHHAGAALGIEFIHIAHVTADPGVFVGH